MVHEVLSVQPRFSPLHQLCRPCCMGAPPYPRRNFRLWLGLRGDIPGKAPDMPPTLRLAIAALVLFGAPGAWAGGDLPLKRVMLSTGGVGYFEYEAKVVGDAVLSLEVRLDRVDDVLKSIVVYDDQGGIGTISLAGKEPLREVFREMPFGPEALESPVALLNALRGAEIAAIGTREVAGRILGVTEETVRLPGDGGTIQRHRLGIMTPEGLRQVILEDVDTLRLADARLQGQVDTALAAMARHGERDRRTLSIRTAQPRSGANAGHRERTVRVAYVVEAPLWKTAYRLTLAPGADARQGDLQGWAVLENLSGEDWQDVDLTVVSGNPVTFRQELYQAYYVNRPEVPVEVLGRVLPKVDDGTVPPPPPPAQAADAFRQRSGRGLALAEALPAMRPAPMAEAPSPAPPGHFAEIAAAESSEATTQVTFHAPTPVTVASGHSLLLPIVSRAVPAERLALYQPATEPHHPLATVRLRNDGSSGLPPGILTLYERGADGVVSFVGDARLAALPVGEERLLSFAVDQKVRIDREDSSGQILTRARAEGGVLQVTTTERSTTRYSIAGAAQESRVVVIEHPRRAGWELVEPKDAKPELTSAAYRLRQEVGPATAATLDVVLERPRAERFELVNLAADQILYYAKAQALPAALRTALARLAELRAAVADRQRAIEQVQRDQSEVGRDQQRLRDNLNAVPRDSDLYRRYLAKLGEQEDRLERLNADLATARAAADAARQALIDYARSLKA
ncbi:MAG: DUF4139 domain-containing protein [Azospirillum sp.]|nr:DUF4139 domain-containing protein [Azospirillum sp.]